MIFQPSWNMDDFSDISHAPSPSPEWDISNPPASENSRDLKEAGIACEHGDMARYVKNTWTNHTLGILWIYIVF